MGKLKTQKLVNAVRKRTAPNATHLVYVRPSNIWNKSQLEGLRRWAGRVDRKPEAVPVPAPRRDGALRFHTLGSSRDKSSLYIMHVGPGRLSPDHLAFVTLCHLLGGMLSEAGREFRVEGGATYGIQTSLTYRREASECWWSGTFRPGELVNAVEQHVEQLERVIDGHFDARSLTVARGTVRAATEGLFANPRRLAQWVATLRGLDRDIRTIAQQWDRSSDLSESSLRRVAASAFYPPHFDFVALLGSPQDYYGLSARGTDIRYDIKTTDDD